VLFPDWGSNLVIDTAEEPLPDDFFADADVVIEVDNRNQRVASASLEPRSVLAGWHPDTDELTLWSSNQHPQKLRGDICTLLGIGDDQLRVIAPDVGGGFGAKASIFPEEPLLVILARALGRPVSWTETRTENMTTTVHGRSQVHHIRVGATRDGKVVAIAGEVIADAGAYPNLAPLLMSMTTQMMPGCYDIPKVQVTAKAVVTNTAPVGAYRGAGRPEATFTIERAMDLLAHELGIDPVELRRRNFVPSSAFPYESATGMTYDSGNYVGTLDRLVGALDLPALRAEQERRIKEGGRLLGVGLATYVEITGGLGFGEDGSVEIEDDGRVVVTTGTSPHGQGHRTAWAQIAADALGLDSIDQVTVLHGDTRFAPSGGGTFGSRSLQFGGSAVNIASVTLADRIRKYAADLLEAAPEDIELVAGRASVRGTRQAGLSFSDLKKTLAEQNANGSPFELKEATFFEQEGWTFPAGAHGVVVEVDPETGQVDLLRVVAVDDCGTIINPMIVEGQVHGGLVQGLAQALWEQMVYAPDGQPLTANLADYTFPSACEVPFFETLSQSTPSPLNPLGAKGVGESGTVASTPAAVNAVLDALRPLGVNHLEMPLTPVRVWEAIRSAEAAKATSH
jgi:carbon-monoxide dehydrogenase large subunit